MPVPEKCKGVLESMKFCPKCGGLLQNRNAESDPVNKMLVCERDQIILMWDCDGDYDYWTISVETPEIRVQSTS